eukprot:scaffold1962_cov241-Pinguiococcus_pyrenoidosus.AAC.3
MRICNPVGVVLELSNRQTSLAAVAAVPDGDQRQLDLYIILFIRGPDKGHLWIAVRPFERPRIAEERISLSSQHRQLAQPQRVQGILQGIVPGAAVASLDRGTEELLCQVLELPLPSGPQRIWIEHHRVDDSRRDHSKSSKIRVKAVAHQDAVRREPLAEVSLHIRHRPSYAFQLLRLDARELGICILKRVGGLDQAVVEDCACPIYQCHPDDLQPGSGVAHLAVQCEHARPNLWRIARLIHDPAVLRHWPSF